jgi:hypothetical protein
LGGRTIRRDGKEGLMMDFAKRIVELFLEKLDFSFKFLVVCTIIMSAIIFCPTIRRWTGMESLFAEYRPVFTLTWFFCAVYVGISILAAFKQRVVTYFALRNEARRKAEIAFQKEYKLLSMLALMPQGERDILSLFKEEDSTEWLPVADCRVVGLVSKGILSRVSRILEYRGPYSSEEACGQYRVNAKFQEFVFVMLKKSLDKE